MYVSHFKEEIRFTNGDTYICIAESEWQDEHGNRIITLTLLLKPDNFIVKRGPNQWQCVEELSAPRPLITKDG